MSSPILDPDCPINVICHGINLLGVGAVAASMTALSERLNFVGRGLLRKPKHELSYGVSPV